MMTTFKNATDDGSPEIKILSSQDYNNKGYDLNALSNTVVAARNPGSWANGKGIRSFCSNY